MFSGESLRKFVTERLTAAAEDIFVVFKRTVVEYEDELERQRKLLDVLLNPQVTLHRIDLPQQLLSTEDEALLDQQLCNQERNSSLDQEEPDLRLVKEEPEEPWSIQEGEQLILKEETDRFMLTLNHEDSEPGLQHELRPLSPNSYDAEAQDPTGNKHRDSQSTKNLRTQPSTIHLNSHISGTSEDQCNPLSDQPFFKCGSCGESFKNKSVLRTHQRVHSGKETHTCKICGKIFSWKSLLMVHVRCHTGERPHSCTTCGKRFLHLSGLKKHNMIHTGEKPFTCTTCGKSLRKKQYLINHMRTHTGERPFSCGTCGKSFSDSTTFIAHKKTHTGAWSFNCRICRKRFRSSHDLRVHMRSHTSKGPYTCSACGKSFLQQTDLDQHRKNHTSKKLSTCRTCGKSFRDDKSVKRHERRIHLKERPHSCSTCGKEFYESYDLKKHILRRHAVQTSMTLYPCSNCGLSYTTKGYLDRHMKKCPLTKHESGI
ncbi:zinc finger protein 501-like [Cheilinus undulatus]|uniref:zinc finger protein 501-like n=1 Tax=Cheilinus undulatus TaxID=241271 RepID=UPI001BD32339|nr:zinc finger protein 501-like [Cheilinus undulatus]